MDQQAPQPPQAPMPPQPQMQPQMPPQQGVPMENPGQTLGIVGIVLNFLGITLGGIILGVMSRNKSRQYGMSTTLVTISLVWGIIATVFVVLGFIILVVVGFLAAASTPSSTSSTSTSNTSSF